VRILLVEDDAAVARQVAAALRGTGYAVDVATDGADALFLGETEPYDTIVLDLGLPGMDGVSVLERWRKTGVQVPVLILTARGTWREKVTGLRAGADDYLAKPFEMEELVARLEALLRRAAGHASPVLAHGYIQLDTSTQRVSRAGSPIELTALEYRLLAYLMHHPARVYSKSELTEHLYEQNFDRDSNVIEVLVNRLRKKLGASLIVTRRGQGYQLSDPDDAP
jgi:two-component system, OmpR family, response regulator